MTDSMQDGDGAIQIGYYFAFLLNSGPNSFDALLSILISHETPLSSRSG